jgi:hypothetical protein
MKQEREKERKQKKERLMQDILRNLRYADVARVFHTFFLLMTVFFSLRPMQIKQIKLKMF